MASKKRSWRDDSTPKAPQQGRIRNWQDKPEKTIGGPAISRRTKILFAAGGLLVGVVAVLIVIFWPEGIDPPRLVLIGAGYETNLSLPHNVHGQRALNELKGWAEAHNKDWGGQKEKGIDIHHHDLTTQEDVIAKSLEGYTGQSVVVFLSVHGGADQNGAYIFADDATPGPEFNANPDKVLYRLDRVFSALEKIPKTKKLLILDATQVENTWGFGMIKNEFAEALANDPRVKQIDNLVILSASGPNERSWVSEEYGRTIFGHFVVEGLKGAADKDKEVGNRDGRITTLELAKYVQSEVEHWVRENRGAIQKPVLFDANNVADEMDLVLVAEDYQEPVPAKYSRPSELKSAWEERFRLEREVPAPMVYTPHLWRRYQDALLRYEALLLAQDPVNAEAMKRVVDETARAIRKGQRLQELALTCSLSAPGAMEFHMDDTTAKKLKGEFLALWNEPTTQAEDYRRRLVDPVTEGAPQQMARLRLIGLLLEEATRGDQGVFQRVCGILATLDDVTDPRPIEAHYALQLQRGLYDKKVGAEVGPIDYNLVHSSLSLRHLSERTSFALPTEPFASSPIASYSEQIHPWIQARLQEADKARRLGEDYLFVGTKGADNAGQNLKQAEQIYKSLQERIPQIHEALTLRDRAAAELPYYTAWLAGKKYHLDHDDITASLEKEVIALWEKLHALTQMLQDPDSVEMDRMTKLIADIKAQLDVDREKSLASEFQKTVKQNRTIVQRNWHEINDLLKVPFIDPDRRLELLATMHQISAHLEEESRTKETETPGLTEAENEKLTINAAKRQSNLALAVLGSQSPEAKVVANSQWTALSVGDQIGKGLRRVANQTVQSTESGLKANLDTATTGLKEASSLVRLLDGGLGQAWIEQNPVQLLRQVEQYRLLVWHTDRTYQDYWASLDEGSRYYRKAGSVYLSEARNVLPMGDNLTEEERTTRLSDVAKQQAQLDIEQNDYAIHRLKGAHFLAASPTTHITDEAFVPMVFGIKGAPSNPEGRPVIWAQAGPGLTFREKTPAERQSLSRVTANPEETKTLYDLIPMSPPDLRAKDESEMVVHGFFRGRYFTQRTPIWLHYRPDLVSLQPEKPRTASVAVQAPEELIRKLSAVNSHLVIVLDCSGSMQNPPKGGTGRRFTLVLDALDQALQLLPEGITLSLYTFGAKEDGDGNVNKRWDKIPWQGRDTQRTTLMRELRGLDNAADLLWFTPLVKALYEVRNDFPQTEEVAKSILVLTDGVDQADRAGNLHFPRGLGDPYQRGDSIEQFLTKAYPRDRDFKRQKGFGVYVSVVGVEVEDKDEAKRAEFEKAITAIGGDYFNVTNAKRDLANALAKALFRIKYFVEERSGTVPPDKLPQDGADVSPVQANLRPVTGLLPGTFDLSLKKTKAQAGRDQRIRLDPGDCLVLRLTSLEQKSQVFRRVRYSEIDRRLVPHRQLAGDPWHLEVRQNQRVQNLETRDGYEGMITLDKEIEFRDDKKDAFQPSPGMIWMSLRSTLQPGGEPQVVSGLRFNPLYHYPAPAWGLYVKDWPRSHRPVLDVWWTEEDKPLIPAVTLERRREFQNLADLFQKTVRANLTETTQTDVTVESVLIEQRKVEIAPGKFRENEDALVVRLSYPDGNKPFFAQLPQEIAQELKGQEHRFYTESGKYTGIFWPVSEEVALQLRSLNVMSVEELKRISRHIPNWELDPPDGNNRPDPLGE